jgi:hypothetical protein
LILLECRRLPPVRAFGPTSLMNLIPSAAYPAHPADAGCSIPRSTLYMFALMVIKLRLPRQHKGLCRLICSSFGQVWISYPWSQEICSLHWETTNSKGVLLFCTVHRSSIGLNQIHHCGPKTSLRPPQSLEVSRFSCSGAIPLAPETFHGPLASFLPVQLFRPMIWSRTRPTNVTTYVWPPRWASLIWQRPS